MKRLAGWILGILGALAAAAGLLRVLLPSRGRTPAGASKDLGQAAQDAARRAEKAARDSQVIASLETRQDRTEAQEQRDADDADLGDMLDRLDAGAGNRRKP